MFRFYQCRFRDSKKKKFTGRNFVQKLCGLVNSFTIESSFGTFTDINNKTQSLNQEKFELMG